MQDPIGPPRSLLLLGGTSELGLATARRMIGRRTRTVWLAGRAGPALDAAAAELRALGATTHTVDFDALDPASHAETLGKVFAEGPVDLVLLSFGLAGDQLNDEADPAAAARVAATNYTGAVSAGLVCGMGLQAQGHGALVVLSSVAGERVRRGDFIFGSSKAGLDAFAQGLGDALYGTGVRVLVVRPGVVRSRRPDQAVPEEYATGVLGLDGPFATTPEAVAEAVERGLRRGSETVWVPATLRPVMAGLRHLPRPLFRRLPV
ncbi:MULTISPECIES: SDR family NAD(P)-dependent oxidoreductase [unclassified Streptomyces]|uniref:SDR family NAD(P)-dependent oxidoreductase n=1 Tax=unclassified Streptomyces TaxID=2593676 RepID=UPI00081DC697|nr:MULTISPECIES: SDR family NAD(P)-dependent oxidoreductase [unclassified Streptomyces]MYR25323.1 SDR family NAD(P)-dependent oxidoreductase [Streptomyces sp. SID4945]SCD64083.1 decaprenylphospho-beta-D-erythro-pentofuranosid-2-ulose 2-reductase [Streptomyces sp. TverLS-915]SCE78604.1 decaprenylphospho-beta-D-erythro-pentofuranosid-2-ulose 2-reductase [Streptomyces sp. LcepLS]